MLWLECVMPTWKSQRRPRPTAVSPHTAFIWVRSGTMKWLPIPSGSVWCVLSIQHVEVHTRLDRQTLRNGPNTGKLAFQLNQCWQKQCRCMQEHSVHSDLANVCKCIESRRAEEQIKGCELPQQKLKLAAVKVWAANERKCNPETVW